MPEQASSSSFNHSGQLDTNLMRDRRAIRWWLYMVCGLIFLMVIVGGATRLTDSGLSITEWKPIHGAIPPLSAAEWDEEFAKYREIPEYQLINKGMSLDEFKGIFWWEWGHRQLGRLIGVAYFFPFIWFWARGRVERPLKPKLLIGFALGAVQGGLGWWMVASGLSERVDVSQYRLAIHLTMACVIFAYLLAIARDLAPMKPAYSALPERSVVWGAGVVLALVFLQIFMGGFVAGLDAGLSFNSWPLMDGRIIPQGLLVMSPKWLNFFENVAMVQFQHRLGAYALFVACAMLTYRVYMVEGARELRPLARLLMASVTVQALLGIATLLKHVPFDYALAHQGMAVVVLAFSVLLFSGARRAPKTLNLL